MRLFSIGLISLLFSLAGFSQSSLNDLKFNVFQNLNSSVNQNYIRLLNESAMGTEQTNVFEFNDWTSMEAHSKKGELLELDSANYHVVDETIFFMHEGRMYFLYPNLIDRVEVGDRTFISINTDKRSKTSYKYFEILTEGDLTLVKNKKIERKEINNHPMGIQHSVKEYKDTEKISYYYLKAGSDELNEVPKNRKNFIKIFQRQKNRMIQFARQNNINNKLEADIIKMFEFHNLLTDNKY